MVKTKPYKVTQRSIHIHTHKKRKRKIYIFLKKGKRATKSINKSINHNKV